MSEAAKSLGVPQPQVLDPCEHQTRSVREPRAAAALCRSVHVNISRRRFRQNSCSFTVCYTFLSTREVLLAYFGQREIDATHQIYCGKGISEWMGKRESILRGLIANETLYQLSYTPVIGERRLAQPANFSKKAPLESCSTGG